MTEKTEPSPFWGWIDIVIALGAMLPAVGDEVELDISVAFEKQ